MSDVTLIWMPPERRAAGKTVAVADGEYELIDLLGRGGMATVYLARHRVTGRRAALKLVVPGELEHLSSAARVSVQRRLLREARAVGAFQHPNVVEFIDAGMVGGCVYIVMEHLEGCLLSDALGEHDVLGWAEVARIGAMIAHGLAAAHAAGVIHRDLKPTNVMLVPQEPRVIAKVFDFGIALLEHDLRGGLTMPGTTVGTPRYMSPEQCRGEVVDHRADIYSLGVLLYRALAGRCPFECPDQALLLGLHEHSPVPPLDVRGVPAAFEALVKRCLAKQPDERPASMGDVARVLDEIAAAAPAAAAGASALARRPMPLPAAAAGASAVARIPTTASAVAAGASAVARRPTTAVTSIGSVVPKRPASAAAVAAVSAPSALASAVAAGASAVATRASAVAARASAVTKRPTVSTAAPVVVAPALAPAVATAPAPALAPAVATAPAHTANATAVPALTANATAAPAPAVATAAATDDSGTFVVGPSSAPRPGAKRASSQPARAKTGGSGTAATGIVARRKRWLIGGGAALAAAALGLAIWVMLPGDTAAPAPPPPRPVVTVPVYIPPVITVAAAAPIQLFDHAVVADLAACWSEARKDTMRRKRVRYLRAARRFVKTCTSAPMSFEE